MSTRGARSTVARERSAVDDKSDCALVLVGADASAPSIGAESDVVPHAPIAPSATQTNESPANRAAKRSMRERLLFSVDR
jgi:hypothetical protein